MEWGVGPSFRAPVDDLGRGLDFEGWPEGAGGAPTGLFVPCKCEGRVTTGRARRVEGGERGRRPP